MSKFLPVRTVLPILLCLLGIPGALLAGELEDHLFSGSKFTQEKNYKEAVREFEVAVGIDPNDANANRLLALSLAKTGDLDKAVEYGLKAAQIEPNYPIYYLLGLIYSNQDKFEKAVEAYEQALKFNTKSYEAWHQLGKVRSTTLNFDKAAEAYQKAAQLNPKFPDAYQGLGSAYYWAGDLAGALQQVDALNKFGFAEQATELERWIKDKETKKKKSAKQHSAKTTPAK